MALLLSFLEADCFDLQILYEIKALSHKLNDILPLLLKKNKPLIMLFRAYRNLDPFLQLH